MAVAMTSIRLSTPSLPTAWAPRMVPSTRVEEELERHGLSTGVIARMAHGMRVDGPVVAPRGPQALLVPSCRGRGEIEHLDDGGPERGGPAYGKAADVVGDPSSLAVGHIGQGDQGIAASHPVRLLDGVTDGIDVLVAGQVDLVDGDATVGAERQAGHLGQSDVGTHADGSDHELTGDGPAVGQGDARGRHLGDGHAGLDDHPVGDQLCSHQDGELGVERAEDLVDRLDDRDGNRLADEVLGRLETRRTRPR